MLLGTAHSVRTWYWSCKACTLPISSGLNNWVDKAPAGIPWENEDSFDSVRNWCRSMPARNQDVSNHSTGARRDITYNIGIKVNQLYSE